MQRFFIWLGKKLFPNARPTETKQSARPAVANRSDRPTNDPVRPAASIPKSAAEHAALRESGKHAVARQVQDKKSRKQEPELRLEGDTGAKAEDEEVFDPYNSGRFDRSKNWESRKRK